MQLPVFCFQSPDAFLLITALLLHLLNTAVLRGSGPACMMPGVLNL